MSMVMTRRGQRRQIRTRQVLEMLGYNTDKAVPDGIFSGSLARAKHVDLVPSKLFFEELQSCCDALISRLLLLAQDIYTIPIQSLIKKQSQLRVQLFYHLIIETAKEDGSLDLMLYTARNLVKVYNIVQRTVQKTRSIPGVEKFVKVAKQMAIDGLSDMEPAGTDMPEMLPDGMAEAGMGKTNERLDSSSLGLDMDDAFKTLIQDALRYGSGGGDDRESKKKV